MIRNAINAAVQEKAIRDLKKDMDMMFMRSEYLEILKQLLLSKEVSIHRNEEIDPQNPCYVVLPPYNQSLVIAQLDSLEEARTFCDYVGLYVLEVKE